MYYVDPKEAVTTYRYLRITMAILVVLLGSAVGLLILGPDKTCWLGSISAYYYTAARAVFVACLCAIGACMIAYQGNGRWEDFALNVSGSLAFVVAFIPTPLKELAVQPTVITCGRSNVPTKDQLERAVNNNLVALMIAAIVAVLVIAWFRSRAGGPLPWILAAIIVSSAVIFWAAPAWVRANGHLIAACTLFGGIIVVVGLNAVTVPHVNDELDPPEPRFRTVYQGIFAAMLAVCAIFGILAVTHAYDHAIFWLEALVLALFAAFWVVQTIELWDARGRAELKSSKTLVN
jgi:hypothetical protein